MLMTFIITTRNPRTRKLVVVMDDDDEVAEYETEEKAAEVARRVPVCEAWGFEIIEVP
jgi:hypothetical protein